ncbi:MAG: YerC/YecD family TrpR-related protein [Dokdonella sp.]
MKRRSLQPEPVPVSPEDTLCKALLSLDTLPQMRALLRDLCTPAELEALTDRWRVVPYLLEELPYREIHDRTAVSITTIGRVARCLNTGNGGYMGVIAAQRRAAINRKASRNATRGATTKLAQSKASK